MPVVPEVSIQNGSVINGGTLVLGQPFYWANPVAREVTVSGCSGFCTQDSFDVPRYTPTQGNGLKEATLLASPTNWNFSETPNEWNAPGMPHIGNPPMQAREQDVA